MESGKCACDSRGLLARVLAEARPAEAWRSRWWVLMRYVLRKVAAGLAEEPDGRLLYGLTLEWLAAAVVRMVRGVFCRADRPSRLPQHLAAVTTM